MITRQCPTEDNVVHPGLREARLHQGGHADVCDGKQEEYRVLDSSQTRFTTVITRPLASVPQKDERIFKITKKVTAEVNFTVAGMYT